MRYEFLFISKVVLFKEDNSIFFIKSFHKHTVATLWNQTFNLLIELIAYWNEQQLSCSMTHINANIILCKMYTLVNLYYSLSKIQRSELLYLVSKNCKFNYRIKTLIQKTCRSTNSIARLKQVIKIDK